MVSGNEGLAERSPVRIQENLIHSGSPGPPGDLYTRDVR